jgi:hypothetical protein
MFFSNFQNFYVINGYYYVTQVRQVDNLTFFWGHQVAILVNAKLENFLQNQICINEIKGNHMNFEV